jgi:prepilin signal peptidase PulO-like enzyme (type II secretory pathway)
MVSWISVPAAVLGFAVGWLSAYLTERVTPAEDAQPIRGRSLLVRDPLAQAALAVIWAAIPLTIAGDLVRWLEAAVLSVPLVQVAVTDLRSRYVYDVVAAVGLVLGVALGWQFHAVEWWWSVLGAAIGALVFLGLYVIGRLVYRGRAEPMARGDITIAAMVGAGAAACTLYALVYGILASGLLALGVLLFVRSGKVYMPYGPGLCLGGLITVFLC